MSLVRAYQAATGALLGGMVDYLRILLNARMARMDERGASAVEYALLVVGVAVACIVSLTLLGKTLGVIFDRTNSQLESTSN